MDYERIINPVVSEIKPSGIRKFFDIAAEMDDIISLGVGEPDFQTPWHIRQAGINALQNGKTRYTANSGLKELREWISKYIEGKLSVKYDPLSEVLVTVGGSEGIDAAVRALVAPDDEVLIVEPSFVCYEPIVRLAGGVPVVIPTKEENNFRLTPDELKSRITPKTKLLVLPYPGNPTGAVMEREDLERIAEVLKETDIMVISDEIYSELTYTGKPHVSLASLDGMQERTVVINGFSKSYSMTGWRLGYALGPAPVIKQMTKIHQFGIMSSPTVSQYAAVEALKNGENDIEAMREEYNTRRRLIVGGFRKLGLECFEPLGAFYAFPCIKSTGLSSEEFCERLLYSKKVALVPGNAFGESGEGYVRASYCYSVEHIKEALKRVGEFLEELKNENKG
ncbi:MAG: aminotransferase class I/II-fold pyridoxal phosphate-dependent enzyme [Ruminococcaceae bacterium]|nr:aminotransferase class I/II-fold pyridoxal phosphate-dependent enzyme [Oscillospiraceae bacterium]